MSTTGKSSTKPPRIALALSGGGFRATLFHLGVLSYLHEQGLLQHVARVGAVSGGSIIAAHLVLNWESYCHPNKFETASSDLLAFVKTDVRGQIVRRWVLAWIMLLPRLFVRKRWTFTKLLEHHYSKLFGSATLNDLRAGNAGRPQTFFYCTSLTSGAVCSFGRSGFMWDDDGTEVSIVAPGLPVALAVAASSAFPPLFPPVKLTHTDLACDRQQFPTPQYLTDGGVYDNLGIDRMLWYHAQKQDIDVFLVSDAEGNVDWTPDDSYAFVVGRNVRASDLLMKRVSDLRYELIKASDLSVVKLGIRSEILDPNDPTLLAPETQRRLRNVRTDLDIFTEAECKCLVAHGYAVAKNGLASSGLGTGNTAVREPVSPTDQAAIEQSRKRRMRLWSWADLASWLSAGTVAVYVAVLLLVSYSIQQRQIAAGLTASLVERDAKLLETLSDKVRTSAASLLELAKERGIEAHIVSGYRSIPEQEDFFAIGRSQPGSVVTNTRVSIHNTGLAFDVGVWRNGVYRADEVKAYKELGQIGKSLGLRWGGDFARFVDMPHFEAQDATEEFERLRACLLPPASTAQEKSADARP